MSDCIRVVDYIRTRGLSPHWLHQAASVDATKLTQAAVQGIEYAERFVIDNVAQYFYQTSNQEYWSLCDFPNLTPFHPVMWMEFMHPSTINSAEFGVTHYNRYQLRGAAALIESAEITECADAVERMTGIPKSLMAEADVRWWQSMTPFSQVGRIDGERVSLELPVAAWLVTGDGHMWMPADRPLFRFPGLTGAAVKQHDPMRLMPMSYSLYPRR